MGGVPPETQKLLVTGKLRSYARSHGRSTWQAKTALTYRLMICCRNYSRQAANRFRSWSWLRWHGVPRRILSKCGKLACFDVIACSDEHVFHLEGGRVTKSRFSAIAAAPSFNPRRAPDDPDGKGEIQPD